MDILILVILSWQLHRMAIAKGVSPWPYVVNFVSLFLGTMLLFVTTAFLITGVKTDLEEWGKLVLPFTPFILLFQIALFIFFRKKISRLADYKEADDSGTPPSSNKKDLSYFR